MKKLKEIKSEWYLKLKQTGFVDIEDEYGRIKNHDRRTIAFENRDKILDFFLTLDNFLITQTLPDLHREILQAYTEGTYIKQICKRVKRSDAYVRNVIRHYKKIITNNEFPQK